MILAVAVLVAVAGSVRPAQAVIGGDRFPAPQEQIVTPDDSIMACQGPRLPTDYHYDCQYYSSEVTASELVHLPAVKVTDDVAGCLPGTQPSVAKTMIYATTAAFQFSASAKLDLKILSGFTGLLNKIKEFGPGLQGGFGYTESTTFGEGKTYTIPADYGKISWGVFSQDAVADTINESVQITSTDISGPSARYFTASGVKTLTPVAEEKSQFPQGTLAKSSRNFASAEEFKTLCPDGALPDYLGGAGSPTPTPTPPAASPPPRQSPGSDRAAEMQAVDSADRLVTDGVKVKAIEAGTGTDLHNQLRNIRSAITNLSDPSSLVTGARRAVDSAAANGSISHDCSGRLEAALAAILPAG
jgi:hypothetical protein